MLALTQSLAMCTWASLVTPLGLSVPLYKISLRNQQSQRPLPALQSVVLGSLLAHPANPPPQAWRGGKCKQHRLESLGRAPRQGCWLVSLPTPGQLPSRPLPSTL